VTGLIIGIDTSMTGNYDSTVTVPNQNTPRFVVEMLMEAVRSQFQMPFLITTSLPVDRHRCR